MTLRAFRSRTVLRPCLVIALVLAAARPVGAQSFAAGVDSIAAKVLSSGKVAGMTIAVVRGADTLVLKGYGHSDLEHGRETPRDAIYQVGSITKQFTAAAILQLMEQRKLRLDDDITRFVPGFPTRGHRLTLRHLLGHTGGIRAWESTIDFARIILLSMPRDSLVAAFSAATFDFLPGDQMKYSNAGYFLLGLVIERASGMSYERYLTERLLRPAGMRHSRYCDNGLSGRYAHGYEQDGDALRPTRRLNLTWPFSAGGLCATARDLLAWNAALHGGRILGPDAYREMIAPGALDDGTPTRYAKGLVPDSAFGRPVLAHSGAMPGFLSLVHYFPADSASVIVLMNTSGPIMPQTIAQAIEWRLFRKE